MPPSVSILIPCYDAERWIAQAVESALAQTWPAKEVIVVDDGSTDGSLDIIRSFGDRIRWESGPNRGGNAARNRLLEMAAGEWLQYLDADDCLLPEKVAAQMNCGLNLNDIDVLYAPVIMEYWEGDRVAGREEAAIPAADTSPWNERAAAHASPLSECAAIRDPWVLLARWQLPQTSAGLWRRAAIVAVGGWKPDQPCCQEHELYLRLLKADKRFAFCSHAGAIYRQWSDHTVCKRNPLLTMTKRLEVVDDLEACLSATGRLTRTRRDAIAHARLECARGIYRFDRPRSIAYAAQALSRHPGFRLPPAACFPWTYRVVFRLAGFEAAERIAAGSRGWRMFRARRARRARSL